MNKLYFDNIHYDDISTTDFYTKIYNFSYNDIIQVLSVYGYTSTIYDLEQGNNFITIQGANNIIYELISYNNDGIFNVYGIMDGNYSSGYHEIDDWFYELINIRKNKLKKIINKIVN